MPASPGQFCWYELLTSDADDAARFYAHVNGWTVQDAGVTTMRYRVFSAASDGVAGLMAIPDELRAAGVPPHWAGYILVDDVDEAVTRVTSAGGTIKRPASDIPTVGRFAVLADPQGAAFTLFRPAENSNRPPPAPYTPGHVGWHELHAADWQSAFDFYAGQFGWEKQQAHDMGAMGTYQTFNIGGGQAGGVMTKSAEFPVPLWLYYFTVAAIDAGVARAVEAGGKVLNGPFEVPGGVFVAQCLDPQGALFALVGPRVA
jgi:predicted enzyme related to lactoylglutathione lyase